MRRFKALLTHQIQLMFIAPPTYVAAFLFLSFMGLMYLVSVMEISQSAASQSPMEKFLAVFWVPVLFMVPLLTMRSLAEERRMGTLEALMSTPVTAFQVVLAKYLACYFFYILLWALTLVFPLIVALSIPQAMADQRIFSPSQTLTGYAFIFASGAMYVAIGIFSSSLTRSTLVAGMLSFCILFLAIVGAGLIMKFTLPDTGWLSWMQAPAEYMQTFRHLEDFSASLFDTRPFFLYFSGAAMLLALTSLITESKS